MEDNTFSEPVRLLLNILSSSLEALEHFSKGCYLEKVNLQVKTTLFREHINTSRIRY